MAKLKAEETEQQEKAAMRLAKQKHEIAMPKKRASDTNGADGTSRIEGRPPPACCRS